jgi:CRP/FNR family cyclic AMP-dependent transcriptional regulator
MPATTETVPFLTALPAPLRAQLEQLATPRGFHPGMTLFQEGARHDEIYFVTAGRVRLEMFVPGRGRQPLMTVGPGDVVGWSPLFAGHTMTATAVALEHVQTLAVNGQALAGLCESNHEAGYHLMRQLVIVLSNRLLATRLQLLDLFHEHQPHRPQPVDAEC